MVTDNNETFSVASDQLYVLVRIMFTFPEGICIETQKLQIYYFYHFDRTQYTVNCTMACENNWAKQK